MKRKGGEEEYNKDEQEQKQVKIMDEQSREIVFKTDDQPKSIGVKAKMYEHFLPNGLKSESFMIGNPLVKSLYDFVREAVSRSTLENLAGELEIEAKLGIFTNNAPGRGSTPTTLASSANNNNNNNNRFRLPVVSPTVLVNPCSHFTRFEANMPSSRHAEFNKILNQLVTDGRFSYTRSKTRDVFMTDNTRKTYSLDNDPSDVTVIAHVKKNKFMDWNVLCPNWPFDIRVTAAMEIPVSNKSDDNRGKSSTAKNDPSMPHPGKPARLKNRVTYRDKNSQDEQSMFSIDLTQVQSSGSGFSHELEVEFIGADRLVSNDLPEKVLEFWTLISSIINCIN